MVRSIFLIVLFGIFFSVSIPKLKAQQKFLPDTVMKRELSRAEAYLFSFKNDSILLITDSLLKALKARAQYDTPFGMRVQLAEALGLEQDQQGEQAMKKLLVIKYKSQEKELWSIHARASLALALLYEKVGRIESSKEEIERVGAVIDRYKLNSLYPRFAVRKASWERLYGDRKAALFYAREALRTAPRYRLLQEEAIGHMLMNLLLPKSSLNERMYHTLEAVERYQKLGDHTGSSYMFDAIAKIHSQRKNFPQALAYNDSTIVAAKRAIAEGHERHETIAGMYQFRGEIYRQMGLLDSALTYLEKGYTMELAFREKDVRDKIIEIDAHYQNALKQKQIQEQQASLHLKNYQLLFFAIVGPLVLLLAVGLFVGYRRQRQAKSKLVEQNALIQTQAAQLKSLDAAKSRFFANISHELRTPLSLIVGPITTLLRDNQFSEKQAMLLKSVNRSARQLELMVKDILDLQKLEVGKMPLHEEPTGLKSFFQMHLGQFESLAQWKPIHYTYDVQIVPALVAELDREKCRQILYNLLSNAFKFTPAHGKVEVAVGTQGDRLFFQVADTGSGIPSDDLPHVFDRFFQSSQKNRFSVAGTGIGLSICYEYTQVMNGDIRVESQPGEGSVFYVSWPVTFSEKPSRILAPVQVREIDEWYEAVTPNVEPVAGIAFPKFDATPKLTILVVEDHPGLRKYLNLILSEKYRVITAENGKVALQKVASGGISFDMILSDLMMPVMDGYQLLEKLKSGDATRHIPVIMLTARAESADRLQALRIGVDDYLTKPFDEEELLVRIANLLKNQSVRRRESLVENQGADARPLHSETDRAWLEKFETYIRDNLASDTLDIPFLSETFAMSESTLLRQLKRLTGLSPVQYLQTVRLNEARLLLEKGATVSIFTLATQVGYKDARSFSRSFRKRFGKLPSDFA